MCSKENVTRSQNTLSRKCSASHLQLGHAVVGGAVRRHQLPLPPVHEPRPDRELRGRRSLGALGYHVAHDLPGLAPRARDTDVQTHEVLLVVNHNLQQKIKLREADLQRSI